ncbi:MAG: RidA family protein [Aquisalimonadaceae bacterium]
MQQIEKRLAELGIDLPAAAAPAGNYVAYTISGSQVFISGQLPIENGAMAVKGILGDDLDIDDGYRAARLCALNLLAQLRVACGGDLDRVSRVLKLGGFVRSTPAFVEAPKCINGASDLMVELFGEAGSHARFAVSVASLPAGAAVEVDGIFEIDASDRRAV